MSNPCEKITAFQPTANILTIIVAPISANKHIAVLRNERPTDLTLKESNAAIASAAIDTIIGDLFVCIRKGLFCVKSLTSHNTNGNRKNVKVIKTQTAKIKAFLMPASLTDETTLAKKKTANGMMKIPRAQKSAPQTLPAFTG